MARRMLLVLVILATAVPAQAQEVAIATAIAFTEGPTVDRDGTVYFTELVSQRILKLTPDGVRRLSSSTYQSSGPVRTRSTPMMCE